MANGLSTWMIRSATGQSPTTSPLVELGRRHGTTAIVSIYAAAFVFSVVLSAVSSPLSPGAYVVIRLIVVLVWVAVGLLFVFVGTKPAHTMATWGVGLVGTVIAFFAALSDFSTSAILAAYGESHAWIGVLDLVIAGGFGWATITMFRAMARLSGPAVGPPPSQMAFQAPFTPSYVQPPMPSGPAESVAPAEPPVPATPAVPPVDMVKETAPQPGRVPPADPPTSPAPTVASPPAYSSTPPSYAYPNTGGTAYQPPAYGASVTDSPGGLYSQGYGTVGMAVAPQNAMATPALILGILVPPAGIVVGHVALSQIKRTNEGGRQLATAGLVIGYILTGIAIASWIAIYAFTMSVTNSINSSLDELTATPTTTEVTATETTPPNYTADPSDPIGNVIRTTAVGACLHKESSGTSITVLYTADCSSSYANYQVTDRVTSTSDCSDNWVQSYSGINDATAVVLCLTTN